MLIMNKRKIIGITIYLGFILLPIYWLVMMSFKTNEEILGQLTYWPETFTLDHYSLIFSDPSWYMGYVNSMIYVAIN
ncbi:MAG: glycerol transport system permease protein, partial [Arenicella sp.]